MVAEYFGAREKSFGALSMIPRKEPYSKPDPLTITAQIKIKTIRKTIAEAVVCFRFFLENTSSLFFFIDGSL